MGTSVLQRLLRHPEVTQVVAPTRRALNVVNPKLSNPVVDFDALPEQAEWWAVDAVICTLGTTLKQAGSKDAFYRVDHDYPLQVGRLALAHGAQTYALNSAMGASASSAVFYSRVKGELQRDLAELGYRSLVFVQPGLIDGPRQEHRPAEAMALRASRALGKWLPVQWRPSRDTRIAEVLVEASLRAAPGLHVVGPMALA